ncbi:hypothetical protein SAV14893_019330 [Streptomyces avermitilis]|uniref:Uncharacterized protein n=1 Tax=Streptomyces avermitilis TaxID=33903 RepID=A0A4D4N287_STRAX|nr:hypothetical protein SAVMC3_31430 [Streptomyces avermitilis]GDY62540.1 hypothetical protein SAV14893_019330 [Streptomyces avermitilis]GDY77347.1 hypothetical protein SAV31267_068320 [Streptomyces avermitilis]GDY86244.1 hypothetical protein SAVCW2_54430 [Streptomyces avermitilis]
MADLGDGEGVGGGTDDGDARGDDEGEGGQGGAEFPAELHGEPFLRTAVLADFSVGRLCRWRREMVPDLYARPPEGGADERGVTS